MDAVVEAKSMFRVVPRGADQQKSEWLRSVGRLFGLTYSQAKKIEYQEVGDLRASRLDAMRATFIEIQERAERRGELLNDLTTKLQAARSNHRSDDPARNRQGAAPFGERSDRAGAGGHGSARAPVAAVPRHRPE